MNNSDLQILNQLAMNAARAAGEIIMDYYPSDITVEYKAVGSSTASQVVTEVDRKAQQAIVEILQPSLKQFDLALLAEESEDDGLRQQKPAFWSIDPMDGTQAFINKKPWFCVSIALVSKYGKPLIGVVYDPLTKNLYHAIDGEGAYKNNQIVRVSELNKKQPLVLNTDPSFEQHHLLEQTQNGLENIAQQLGLNGAEIHYQDGAVMKACIILEQPNNCYFKYPRKENSGGSIWDYAATACLFNEAGAIATDISGLPFELNRVDNTFMNHRGIMFCGKAKVAELVMKLARTVEKNK